MLGSNNRLAYQVTVEITPEAWAALLPRDRVVLARILRSLNPELVLELEAAALELLRSEALQLPPTNPSEVLNA